MKTRLKIEKIIIDLKGLSEKVFFFNGKFKTISATLKFLFKVSTQEARFSLFKNSN